MNKYIIILWKSKHGDIVCVYSASSDRHKEYVAGPFQSAGGVTRGLAVIRTR